MSPATVPHAREAAAERVLDAPYTPQAFPGTLRMRIPAEPPRRARRGAAARIASTTLLAGVVLLILVAVLGMVLGAWRFTVIDTGSMRPTLNPGDVVVLRPEGISDMRKGQIVAFHPPGEPHLTVTHRLVSIERKRNGVIIQTKGDANNAKDPWRAHLVGNTVWRVDLKAPMLGYVVVWSQNRLAHFALIALIVVLIASMLLGSIWRPTRPK